MENSLNYRKRKKFIVNFTYALIIFAVVLVAGKYGLPLVSPFILAFLIAYILNKPSRFISKKLHVNPKFISILLVLLFYSTVGILISLIGIKVISAIGNLVSYLPYAYSSHIEPLMMSLFLWLETTFSHLDPALVDTLGEFFTTFTQSLGKMISDLSLSAVGYISSYATSLPGLLIKTVLMIIATFFFAADYEKTTSFIMRQFSDKVRNLIIQIKAYVLGTLFVCIRSYAIIMTLTFLELSVGLSIIGIENAIGTALFIAIFDILPVFGTGGIMIPWALITLIQGNVTLGIALLAVYGAVTIIRNILEPKIVGSQIGLHPLITLISIFVGAQLFGIVGLFGFPILLSLLVYLNGNGTIKLFK